MPSLAFGRLALNIARKDWSESWGVVAALTAGLMVPALLLHFAPDRSQDFSKGLFAGLLAGAGFGYAQYGFLNERQRGTLEMLLHLPLQASHLILAKYASVFSLTLVTVNLPAFFLRDPKLILMANAAAVFLSTLFLAATIVSEKPWAPQVPIWLLLVFVLPIERLFARYYPTGLGAFETLRAHPLRLAILALLAVPIMIAVSTRLFAARLHD